ncbi:putative indolepyruvate ferredoxin oxidoreductase, beta subunit [delta proteobacterium NaphS2]|nr:putative indolepyruvate ferredoxin oxidoreductase, beta subunit [delta proteobacterium NaphS2]
MTAPQLPIDPYNVIITGVGGQGNVLASRLMGRMLVAQDYYVTIGETFGASQRGGSVMSHLRISTRSAWSPQIPHGRAHMVIAIEPSEAFRVLAVYGNAEIQVIWNTRPIHPVSVITGQAVYPSLEEIAQGLNELSAQNWPLEATSQAQTMGNPILGNIMMVGALSAVSDLPLGSDIFEETINEMMPPAKVPINLQAFSWGRAALT